MLCTSLTFNSVLSATPTVPEQTSKAIAYAEAKVDEALAKIGELVPTTTIVTKHNQADFISIFKSIFKDMGFENYAVAGHRDNDAFHIIVILDFPEINHRVRCEGFYPWKDPIEI